MLFQGTCVSNCEVMRICKTGLLAVIQLTVKNKTNKTTTYDVMFWWRLHLIRSTHIM